MLVSEYNKLYDNQLILTSLTELLNVLVKFKMLIKHTENYKYEMRK